MSTSSSIKVYSEKYLKKQVRKTVVEDALKKPDKSTHEEVMISSAQNLKAIHTVGKTPARE